MNGETPRDPISAAPESQGQGLADEDDRAGAPQGEARIPYIREHAPSSPPGRRKATLTGPPSTPPTSGPEQALAYSAIPGPAPLPRVPGVGGSGEDGASRSGSITGRHRSRRILRSPDARPAGSPSAPPSAPETLPNPTVVGGSDAPQGPVSLSAPAPEVRDDDWGDSADPADAPAGAPAGAAAEAADPASTQHSREAPTEPAPAPDPASTPAPLSSTETPPPSPLAVRTIPRPVPRPATTKPPALAAGGLADPDSVAVIQPIRIIDVMSDLPAVPGLYPVVTTDEAEDDEEAGLPLRLLSDGPTPIDAGSYLRELEARVAGADSAPEVVARSSSEELEPEPIEELEPEPRSEAEPTSIEEIEAREASDDLIPVPASEPERMPDSTEEIEPDRISDSGEEIAIDMVDDQPAVSAPRPPPPPKRPPAMASPDLAAFTTSVPPPAISSPGQALAQAPASTPAAPPPPPLKQATRPGEGPPAAAPTEDAPRRKKPWWEELFSEDFIRTMDRVDPNVVRRETNFIEERLGMEKGAVILDLACGPGMHAVEMASRGYSVVGYDLSLAMLARASDEAQDRGQKLNFLQGDMREMAFEETFDAVYSWSTSFGYFEEDKNADVLVRIHRALRTGGLLLLDVVNRDYVTGRQPSLVWFEGEGCVCMDEMSVDFFTSRLKVKRTVMFEDGRSRELDYSIRIYGLHEMGKLLHEAGFKVLEVTGHPAHPGVFFGSESPRLIILAERS